MNKQTTQISDATPVAMLTVGQLKELFTLNREVSPIETQPPKRYIYGLGGIRKLCDCSHGTAQKLKDTILQPAVSQVGRKIIVDVDMAMELLKGRGKVW
ncbi:MAG: DUF3853 family protein [Rikenellaceae bacterium]